MKNLTQLVLAVALITFLVSAASADVPTTTGTISKVTVYRGQALVTRTVSIDLPPGASEFIVRDLPTMIVPESIYAQTSDDTPVELQLLDRLPYTDDTSIKIELAKTEPELSTDSEYLRTTGKKTFFAGTSSWCRILLRRIQ